MRARLWLVRQWSILSACRSASSLSDPARTETAYTTGNYRRLAGLKRVWDPDNVFHRNHNIPPG